MRNIDLEVCELLCAKFCHDLSGPIGAINNGIDFLDSENQPMKEKAAELVKLSSNQAVNRLSFFRQAYGSYAADGSIDLSQVRALIDKYIKDTKIDVEFINLDGHDKSVKPVIAKLILNLLIVASSIILLNGKVKFDFMNDADLKAIKISADGSIAKEDKDLKEILTTDDSSIEKTTVNIQQFYTKFLLNEASASVKLENNKNGAEMEINFA